MEWLALTDVKQVDADTNPMKQHGYTKVCKCGYVFGFNRWQKRTTVELDEKHSVFVSTVFLELDRSGYLYETMVFPEKGHFAADITRRYKTKLEAKLGHAGIVKQLKAGEYEIVGKGKDRRLVKKEN